jgi:hypothetical protein
MEQRHKKGGLPALEPALELSPIAISRVLPRPLAHSCWTKSALRITEQDAWTAERRWTPSKTQRPSEESRCPPSIFTPRPD